MELLKNTTNFENIKSLLSNDPYNLIIKEDPNFPSLFMVTYDNNISNMNNEFVKLCRGLILEKNTNKIVCYTFNKGIDADTSSYTCPPELDWKTTRVEHSIDGTQIRLFYYNNKWNYATTRCIDANKARWFNKKSFYEMFKDAEYLIDYSKLDTKCCYSFVLQHPENRIVVKYDKPTLVHVLTRNLETLEEINVNIGVKKPKVYKNFKKYSDVINAANGTDCEEGYMLCDKNKNRIKIKNIGYKKIKELRGNTNNLFYRYLQLRYDNLVDTYLSFFPEYTNNFKLYELDIRRLAKQVHQYYVNKHILKINDTIPKHIYPMIYKLHGEYMSKHNITTVNVVLSHLNQLHPSLLCHMYNKTFVPHHPFH